VADEEKRFNMVCQLHTVVSEKKRDRDNEMVRLWQELGARLSLATFYWVFGSAFAILLAIQGINYATLASLTVSMGRITEQTLYQKEKLDKHLDAYDRIREGRAFKRLYGDDVNGKD
jgi:type VI protein secretion system component VasF